MNGTPRLLGGRYEVGHLIGRGGMAEVHAGHDTRLGRTVAIKMLRSDLARDPAFLARFRREAQSAAGLNHPAIVAVYDSGEDSAVESGGARVAVPYIVMELVEGRTLREVLNEQTAMDPGEAACADRGHPGGTGLQPPDGHRPPRHQAGQRDAHRPRRRQGDGLRHRPCRGRHRGHDDPDAVGRRYGAVPLPRAGAGHHRGRPLRPLLHRLPALRAAHRPDAVRRRLPGVHRLPARRRAAAAPVAAPSRDQPRPGCGRAARAGQGPRGPLPGRRDVRGRRRRPPAPATRSARRRGAPRRAARQPGPCPTGATRPWP